MCACDLYPPPSLQNGGDLTLWDGERHTPQFYARQNMLQDILSILAANGCVDDLSDASSNLDMAPIPQYTYHQQPL